MHGLKYIAHLGFDRAAVFVFYFGVPRKWTLVWLPWSKLLTTCIFAQQCNYTLASLLSMPMSASSVSIRLHSLHLFAHFCASWDYAKSADLSIGMFQLDVCCSWALVTVALLLFLSEKKIKVNDGYLKFPGRQQSRRTNNCWLPWLFTKCLCSKHTKASFPFFNNESLAMQCLNEW